MRDKNYNFITEKKNYKLDLKLEPYIKQGLTNL